MPPIYYLNPPPNPFWDFVAGLEDHPFFRGPPPASAFRQSGERSAPPPAPEAQPQPTMSEKAQGKQPYVEDPPEVDPSTVKPESKKTEERAFPFRGNGRFAGAFGEDGNKDKTPGCGKDRETRREERREARECRRERGGRCGRPGSVPGPNGPPPFFGYGHPFFARPSLPGPDFQGSPRGPWDRHHRPGPPHGPPPHPHDHHDHHRRGGPPDMHNRDRRHGHPHGPSHQRPPFDLAEFLNKLGSKLGIDLTNAADGLGLVQDRFTAGRTTAEVDFEPRADIFENPSAYTIHLSLPGAKKEDVGVEYEGEHSTLRITGVVHRPEVDEQMMGELVVDGRKRETGVFEKAIRLGTKRDPANIDVAGITAKMTDGVLVVRIPKATPTEQKREVNISTEGSNSEPLNHVHPQPQPDYENDYSEKPVLFDADDQASVAASDAPHQRGEISLVDMMDTDVPVVSSSPLPKERDTTPVAESKAQESENEKGKETEDEKEQLPAYTVEANHAADEDDWERFSDDSGEGEYIKIDVK